jgi:hypothetical protein
LLAVAESWVNGEIGEAGDLLEAAGDLPADGRGNTLFGGLVGRGGGGVGGFLSFSEGNEVDDVGGWQCRVG